MPRLRQFLSACSLTPATGIVVAVAVVSVGAAVARAAEPALETLGLDQALQLARRHNYDLEQARARLEQARAAVGQTRAALWPQLTGQGRYTHNYKQIELLLPPITGAPPGPIVIQKEEQLDASATLTLPLVAPALYPSLTAAHRTAEAAAATFAVNETAILYQTAQTFFAAAGADELMLARRHAVEVASRTLKDARTRLEAGTATRVEITRAEAALVRARQQSVDAESTRDRAYRALATLVGVQAVARVAPPAVAPPLPEPIDEMDALSLRPEIAAALRQVAAADASARAFAWRWAPSLSGFGTLHGFNYAGFSGDQYSWAAGLQLDWQLYDGGTRDAQRRQAAAERREAEARLGLARRTVSDELRNAAQDLKTEQLALAAAGRQLDLARETLELVRAQHEAGTATQLDLLVAQDALVSAEVELAQARFTLQLGDLALARAAGTFPQRSHP
jgi:outer membrane protein TolC